MNSLNPYNYYKHQMPIESTSYFFTASITCFHNLRVENSCSSLESRLRQTTKREILRLCFLKKKKKKKEFIDENSAKIIVAFHGNAKKSILSEKLKET